MVTEKAICSELAMIEVKETKWWIWLNISFVYVRSNKIVFYNKNYEIKLLELTVFLLYSNWIEDGRYRDSLM